MIKHIICTKSTPTCYQSHPRIINPSLQELRLLAHVFDTAPSGDAAAVCDAIERFGEDVLNPAGQWLKAPHGGGVTGVVPKTAILNDFDGDIWRYMAMKDPFCLGGW